MVAGLNGCVKRLNEHAEYIIDLAKDGIDITKNEVEAVLKKEQGLLAGFKSRMGALGCFVTILESAEASVKTILDALHAPIWKGKTAFRQMEDAQKNFEEWESLSALLQKETSPVLEDLANAHKGIRCIRSNTVEQLDMNLEDVKKQCGELPTITEKATVVLEHLVADDIKEVNASFATFHAGEADARSEVIDQMNRVCLL